MLSCYEINGCILEWHAPCFTVKFTEIWKGLANVGTEVYQSVTKGNKEIYDAGHPAVKSRSWITELLTVRAKNYCQR